MMSKSGIYHPGSFPESDYTPFGFIDNPYHGAVYNQSGIIRSVPPLGFGFWCRSFPWYGTGPTRNINYLSLLRPGISIDGVLFYDEESFRKEDVKIVSKHHSSNIMSYNFTAYGADFDLRYFMDGEHTLSCRIEIVNHKRTE